MQANAIADYEQTARGGRAASEWQRAGNPAEDLDGWTGSENQEDWEVEDAEQDESLTEQMLRVQEEERQRISRELHDELGHALMEISMNLEALKEAKGVEDDAVREKFADTHMLVQQTMDTVHRFARELRPAMLDELGLLPALRSYAHDFAGRTGLGISFYADAAAERLSNDRKTAIYRIIQESLTNVAKHAQAHGVEISIRKVNGAVSVMVADDGQSSKGDFLESGRRRHRLGLVGMQERARLVGGEFSIEPRASGGTTVRVVVPLKTAGPERHCRSQKRVNGFRFKPELAKA